MRNITQLGRCPMDKMIYLVLGTLASLSLVFLQDGGLALLAITTGLLFKWEVE